MRTCATLTKPWTNATTPVEIKRFKQRKTVAEGVETQAHWDQLASLGCDYAQGYFIARPMPPEEFQAWRAHFDASLLMATRQG